MAARIADKFLRLVTITSLAAVPATALLYPILYTVDGGERAVIMDYVRGKVLDDVIPEGTHIRMPLIQKPIVFDVRTKFRAIPTATGTKGMYYLLSCLSIMSFYFSFSSIVVMFIALTHHIVFLFVATNRLKILILTSNQYTMCACTKCNVIRLNC